MKVFSFSKIFWLTGIIFIFSSCFKDLDTVPTDKDELTSAAVYDDPANYKKVLARLYSGLAVTGQQGPAGQPDISGIDEGFGQYLRMYWYLQELSTDEAVIGWNDATIQDFHNQDWSSDDGFIYACYSRIFYQVSICNEFLRETTDAKLDSRNVDANLRSEIKTYRAEARFLRALSYYHALDLFRNVPFVTEEDAVGAFFPKQTTATELYTWLETEIKAFEADLAAPRTNEYGRADQAAAWMLLAKLYLNAEVYAGKSAYNDAVTYSKKVIDAGFELEPKYANLFVADNNKSKEIIFPITFDGVHTRTYGGTTFLVHAAIGGKKMVPADFGVDGGWGGLRTTSAIVNKFPANGDGRALFFSDEQNLEIADISQFTDGYAVAKYKNVTSASGNTVIVAPNQGNANYPKLNVPGSYQGWDPALSTTVMSSPNSDEKYEGYFYFDAGTEFKFALGGWDTNWGDTGADGTLEPGGDNLKITEAGLYKVNADLTALTYTIAKTDWGLIGSATSTGWDSDLDMTYNPDEKALVITTDLIAGEIKFRANDGWDLNYGDDSADAILEAGGANIAIAVAGTYTIKLYLDAPDHTYTIEKVVYSAGSDLTFVDTDFPMFRLADAYLIYAEAVLRGGAGGDQGTAVQYINTLRERAYGNNSGNITTGDLNLDFILDERARELLWEGHRRTDLVRFGQFTNGSYVWPWKGGVAGGNAVDECRDVYPIPSQDLNANNNLKQNGTGCY